MIECKALSVNYGRKRIIKALDLQADAGITVVLGKNGSGKTTLLRALSGGKKPHGGEILLNGSPLESYGRGELSRQLSILPQNLPRPMITVRELTEAGRFPYTGSFGSMTDTDRNAVNSALETTGMDQIADRLVCHLSGGERQLAYFTMLLAQNTETVLLDEPTANLDTVYADRVCELLSCMRDSGRTLVLSMHDLARAVRLADRILVLDRGELIFYDTAAAFASSGIPESLFEVSWHEFSENGRNYSGFFPCRGTAGIHK